MKHKNQFPSHQKQPQKEEKNKTQEQNQPIKESLNDSKLDRGWIADSFKNSAASSKRKSIIDQNTAQSLEEIQPNELNLINNSDVLWKHLRDQQKQLEEYKYRMRQIIGIQDESENEDDYQNLSKFNHLKVLKSKIKQNNSNLMALNALAQSPSKQSDFLEILKQIQILPVKNIDILIDGKFQKDLLKKNNSINNKEQIYVQNSGILGKKVQNYNYTKKNIQRNVRQMINENSINNNSKLTNKSQQKEIQKQTNDDYLHLQGQKFTKSQNKMFNLDNIKNMLSYTTENLETETEFNQLSFRIENQQISQIKQRHHSSQKKELTAPILQNKKKETKHILDMRDKLDLNKTDEQTNSALLNPLYKNRENTQANQDIKQDANLQKEKGKRIQLKNQKSIEIKNVEIENEIQSLKGEEDVVIIVTNQSENFNLKNQSDVANKISNGTLQQFVIQNSQALLFPQHNNDKSDASKSRAQSHKYNQKETENNINEKYSNENKKMLENRKSTQNFPTKILASQQDVHELKSEKKLRKNSSANNQSMQTLQKNIQSISPPISPNFPIQIMARNQQVPTFIGMYPMINIENFPIIKSQMFQNDESNEFVIYQTNDSINIYSQKKNLEKKNTQKLQNHLLPSINNDIQNSLSPKSIQKSKSKIIDQKSQTKFNFSKILSNESLGFKQKEDPFSSQKIIEDDMRSNYQMNTDDNQNSIYEQNLQNFASNFKIVDQYQQAQLAQIFEIHEWAKMQFQFQQQLNQQINISQFQNEIMDKNMLSNIKIEKQNVHQSQDKNNLTQSIINMNQFSEREFPFIKDSNLKGKSLKSKQDFKQKQFYRSSMIMIKGNQFGNQNQDTFQIDQLQSSSFKRNIFSQNKSVKSKLMQKQQYQQKKESKFISDKDRSKQKNYKLIEEIIKSDETDYINAQSDENNQLLTSNFNKLETEANKTFLNVNQNYEILEQKSLNNSTELQTQQQDNQLHKSQSQLDKNFKKFRQELLTQKDDLIKSFKYKNDLMNLKKVEKEFKSHEESHSLKDITKRKIVHQRIPSKEDMNLLEQAKSDRSSSPSKSQKSKSNQFQFQMENARQSKLISERTLSSNANKMPKLKLHQINILQNKENDKNESQVKKIEQSIQNQNNQIDLQYLQKTLKHLDQLSIQGIYDQYQKLRDQRLSKQKKMSLSYLLNQQHNEPEINQSLQQNDEFFMQRNKSNLISKKIQKANNFVIYDRFKICGNQQLKNLHQQFANDSAQNEISDSNQKSEFPILQQSQIQFVPRRATSQIENENGHTKLQNTQANFQFQKTTRNFQNTQNTFSYKIETHSSNDMSSPSQKDVYQKKMFNSSQRVFKSGIFKNNIQKLEKEKLKILNEKISEKKELNFSHKKLNESIKIQKINVNQFEPHQESSIDLNNKDQTLLSNSQIKSLENTNEDEQFFTIKSTQKIEKNKKLELILNELKSIKKNPKAVTPLQFMKNFGQANESQKIENIQEKNIKDKFITQQSLNIQAFNPNSSRNFELIKMYGRQSSQNLRYHDDNIQQYLQKIIFNKCDSLKTQQLSNFIKKRKKPKQDFEMKELNIEVQKENKKKKITSSILQQSYNQIIQMQKMRKLQIQKEMDENLYLIQDSNNIIDQIKLNDKILKNNQKLLAVYITDENLSEIKKTEKKTEYQQSAQKLLQSSISIPNDHIEKSNSGRNFKESKKKSEALKRNPSLRIISQGSYHRMEESPRNQFSKQRDMQEDKSSRYKQFQLHKVPEGDLRGII